MSKSSTGQFLSAVEVGEVVVNGRIGCGAVLCQCRWHGPPGHYREQQQHAKTRQVHGYLPYTRYYSPSRRPRPRASHGRQTRNACASVACWMSSSETEKRESAGQRQVGAAMLLLDPK